MTGAVDGIRVIDFGQYIAGPLAAVMLADQGADVVHVDPPMGRVSTAGWRLRSRFSTTRSSRAGAPRPGRP